MGSKKILIEVAKWAGWIVAIVTFAVQNFPA